MDRKERNNMTGRRELIGQEGKDYWDRKERTNRTGRRDLIGHEEED